LLLYYFTITKNIFYINITLTFTVEEEGSEGGSIGRDPINSARSSTSEVFTEDGKKKGGKKNKEARKSGGLLKGFFK
jgi:hypothetical protein